MNNNCMQTRWKPISPSTYVYCFLNKL